MISHRPNKIRFAAGCGWLLTILGGGIYQALSITVVAASFVEAASTFVLLHRWRRSADVDVWLYRLYSLNCTLTMLAFLGMAGGFIRISLGWVFVLATPGMIAGTALVDDAGRYSKASAMSVVVIAITGILYFFISK